MINSSKGLNSSIYPTDVNLRSGFFFFSGKGEKKNAWYIYLMGRLLPLIKMSVNICVFVSDFT